jgi:hypothetical protein
VQAEEAVPVRHEARAGRSVLERLGEMDASLVRSTPRAASSVRTEDCHRASPAPWVQSSGGRPGTSNSPALLPPTRSSPAARTLRPSTSPASAASRPPLLGHDDRGGRYPMGPDVPLHHT